MIAYAEVIIFNKEWNRGLTSSLLIKLSRDEVFLYNKKMRSIVQKQCVYRCVDAQLTRTEQKLCDIRSWNARECEARFGSAIENTVQWQRSWKEVQIWVLYKEYGEKLL